MLTVNVTYIVATSQTMVITASHESSIELCHIVAAIVMSVSIVQVVSGALWSISTQQVQLETSLNIASGAT